ncbi:hypothetical protein ACFL1N_09560 [Thermodesulfobacteriota bacterium]
MEYDDYEDEYYDEFDEDIIFEEDLDNLDESDNIINEDFKTTTPHDEFTIEDAFFLGSMMGFAFEEGLEEKRRRKADEKKSNPEDIFDLDIEDKEKY